MDAAIIGLVGVLIGGIISSITTFVTTRLNNQHQLRLEQKKATITKRNTLDKELRSQVAEVAREMLSAQHSMEWVCWHAVHASGLIDGIIADEYHKEIHVTFPKLLGDLAVVASLNSSTYEKLTSLANKLYAIDGKIAEALVHYKKSPQESTKVLKECYPETLSLYKDLPKELAKIMSFIDID